LKPSRPGHKAETPIRIGVSACVLGQNVRFDGGHKLDHFVRDTLGSFVQFVHVCPELEMGLGVPRESLRLVRIGKSVRMISQSGVDHTATMKDYARKRCDRLEGEALCGFIVQKNSPSCGMERVKVYRENTMPERNGRGMFTAALMERMPHLPVEEVGRLNDPGLRENFVERVFAYRRLRQMFSGRWTVGDLVAFHAREKLLLLSHDRPSYEKLGRLVASAKRRPRAEVADEYQKLMLEALGRLATRGKQTNVLSHISGYFKSLLDDDDRREVREVIESYRNGLVPLIVPITLLRHHVRRHGVDYLAQQTYMDPHPRELMLRNHA